MRKGNSAENARRGCAECTEMLDESAVRCGRECARFGTEIVLRLLNEMRGMRDGNALEMLDGTASNCHSGFIPGSPFIVRGNRARDTEGNSVEIAERECTGNVRRECRGILPRPPYPFCNVTPDFESESFNQVILA